MRKLTLILALLATIGLVAPDDATACWRLRRGARCAPLYMPCQPINNQLPTEPPSPEPNTPNGAAARVRILLIGDTNDEKIGKGVQSNLANLKKILESGIPAERRDSIQILDGNHLSSENIQNAIDQWDIQAEESIFCYHAGHGAYDPNRAQDDPSNGHFLQLPKSESLMRRDIWEKLKKKNARLTVLITDTCNVEATATIGLPYSTTRVAGENQLLVNLLLNQKGDVDISGSSKDQFGWFTPQGGWFTLSLLKIFQEDTSPNVSDVTWSGFLKNVSDETNSYYQARRKEVLANPGAMDKRTLGYLTNQAEQRPQAFRLEVQPFVSANSLQSPAEAQVIVQVPSGAKLSFDGRPTAQTTLRRVFSTPVLQSGFAYQYTLTIETDKNGILVTDSKQVVVRAGETTHVNFAESTVTFGQSFQTLR